MFEILRRLLRHLGVDAEKLPSRDQQIDGGAIADLREVIDSGGYGYYEGIRIIAHLLKATAKLAWYRRPSACVHSASNESLTAIRNWRDWDCNHNGKQSWPARAASTSATGTRSDWTEYTPVTRGMR